MLAVRREPPCPGCDPLGAGLQPAPALYTAVPIGGRDQTPSARRWRTATTTAPAQSSAHGERTADIDRAKITTANQTASGGALRLLTQILDRYPSLEAFLTQLYRELDEPTEQLPRLHPDAPRLNPPWWPITTEPATSQPRHALRDTAEESTINRPDVPSHAQSCHHNRR
ncbi:hypothetical protein [Nocardia tengchongensis]|uniref:hypothetical protein n=1 Tax=Nocardia tengchongensis TaxID=2055889 RepID=UPI003669976A